MYQPLIKFHPHPAIITQVLTIFVQEQTQIYYEDRTSTGGFYE